MSERLTPIETVMWRVGHDARLRMTIGNLMVLEGAPDRDALVERLAEAASAVPRLRSRPDDRARLVTPSWVEDPSFDSRDHLDSVALPTPGDRRQLLDVVALLEPRPFDPERPPWDVTVIEGLPDGHAALYLRAHHALTDGMGGIALVRALLDTAAVAAPEPAESAGAAEAVEGTDGSAVPGSVTAVAAFERRQPGTFSVTIDLTRAAGATRSAVASARNVDALGSAMQMAQRGLDTANSVSRQVVVTGGALSSLPASRSILNRFEIVSVPRAREIALSLGGSRNDLLVAAAASGLGEYQARLGISTGELRIATPTGRHRDDGPGGNWFAPMRTAVPTDARHPGPYFGVVAERLARARREPAVQLSGTLAAAVRRLPNRVLVGALHAQARSVDFAATSFPGLRTPQSVCGVSLLESYPFGARLGCLMNITAFGNGDRLDVGVSFDPVAITEPEVLLECLEAAFQNFAGQPESAPGSRRRFRRS